MSNQSYRIRLLEKEDFERGFFETLENLRSVGNLSVERAREIYGEIKSNPNHTVYIAELDGQVVGVTTLLTEPKFIHEGGRVGHIEDVATRKGYEGKGIATALISTAVEEARRRGCYKVILDCSLSNVPWYVKLDFYPHEIEMRKDLK